MTTTTLDRLDIRSSDDRGHSLAHVVDVDGHGQPVPVALCGYRVRGVPAAWDAPAASYEWPAPASASTAEAVGPVPANELAT
jgi:hypothetical protein